MIFVRSREYFPTTCSTEVKDQNRIMKLGAGKKHLITTDYFLLLLVHSAFGFDCLFCCFGLFLNTEINRNEHMKYIVGSFFSLKLETGTFSNLLYYEILPAQLLLPSTCIT